MKRLRTRLLTVTTIVALAAGLTVATTAPADAYYCWGGVRVHLSVPEASSDFTFYPRCSDNRAHWNGVVRDTACDDRHARVVLIANQRFGYWQWERSHKATNGCWSSSTFNASDDALWGASDGSWSLYTCVFAQGWWRNSDPDCDVVSG